MKLIVAFLFVLMASFGCAYTGIETDEDRRIMAERVAANMAKSRAELWNSAWICEPNGGKLNCQAVTWEGTGGIETFDPDIEDIYKIDFDKWELVDTNCLYFSQFDEKGYNSISIWRDGEVLINGEPMELERNEIWAIKHLFGYIVYRMECERD